jgi:cation diffusion facilitator family transporter
MQDAGGISHLAVPAGRSGGDALSKPLLGSPRTNLHVPVYSPYGGKEVVQTEASQSDCNACLSGIFSGGGGSGGDESSREVALVIRSSVWINFLLFLAKLYAFIISRSLAVLASLVDSGIDLLGQGALMWTNHLAQRGTQEEYPVGRTRLEPVGVMICAVVMGMASIEVISTSSMKLVKYWDSEPPPLDFGWDTAFLLVGIIMLKGILWLWCSRVAERSRSDAVEAIAQDNQNDVLSNMAALLAGELSSPFFLNKFSRGLWMCDPLAGVLISVYIIYTWLMTGREQVEMIVGKKAEPEFLKRIQELAQAHNDKMQLDEMKAYHFGPKYLVELEVVMPEDTPLRESHDEGLKLQDEIEKMEEVERCFVHIDYQMRQHDDHDPGVPLSEKLYGAKNRETPRAHSLGLLTAEGVPFAKENSQDSRV